LISFQSPIAPVVGNTFLWFEIDKSDLKNEMAVFKNSLCNNEKNNLFESHSGKFIQKSVSKSLQYGSSCQYINILPISSATSEHIEIDPEII